MAFAWEWGRQGSRPVGLTLISAIHCGGWASRVVARIVLLGIAQREGGTHGTATPHGRTTHALSACGSITWPLGLCPDPSLTRGIFRPALDGWDFDLIVFFFFGHE